MKMKSEIEDNSPAIKALGPLFKLTQISIWDNGYSSDIPKPKHIRFKYYDDDDDDDDDGDIVGVDVVEDEGVNEEMCLLGLPLSFQTNKQNSKGQSKGKVKVPRHMKQDSQKRLDEQSCRSSEEKPCCADFQVKSSHISSFSLPNQSEHSGCGSNVTDDSERLPYVRERHTCREMASHLIHDGIEEHAHDSSTLNVLAETANDELTGVDLHKEIEMMHGDDISNFSVTNTSSGSNILDDHLEENMSLTEQLNAHGSILGTSIMQLENSGSATIEQALLSDMSKDTSHNMMVLDQEYDDSGICCGTCGDWSAYWDSFYSRYYFYNAQTKDSTWYPPPGMESFAFGESCGLVNESNMGLSKSDAGPLKDQSEEVQSITCELNTGILDDHCQDEMAFKSSLNTVECSHTCEYEIRQKDCLDMSKDHSLKSEVGSPCENSDKDCDGNIVVAQLSNASSHECAVETTCDDDFANDMQIEEGDATNNNLHMVDTSGSTKRRTRRKHRRRKNSVHDVETNETCKAEKSYIDIEKYWCQRYQLFSRFDEGIKMDEEGWFSVTPEAIARHQASRCGGGTVIDCFTGAGGNAIQFAKTSKHVVAIDIDPYKINYASHNAAIYGVDDKINFVVGDSFSLASNLKADTVFLSPPWGGPDYVKVKPYSLQMLQPCDGQILFDTFKAIAPLIIMFLPRNIDIEQLAQLSISAHPPWSLEVEKNILNGKFKAVTAYFRRT